LVTPDFDFLIIGVRYGGFAPREALSPAWVKEPLALTIIVLGDQMPKALLVGASI